MSKLTNSFSVELAVKYGTRAAIIYNHVVSLSHSTFSLEFLSHLVNYLTDEEIRDAIFVLKQNNLISVKNGRVSLKDEVK